MEHTNSSKPVNYQVGAHDVDTSTINFGSDADDDDFVAFELEAQTVFKRLADDIYESPEAGIREPLTNAVTAVLKAINRGHISEGEGVVEYTIRDTGDDIRLRIKDNGIGISREELETVVAIIGRSTTRDDGDLAGQFGMGFLAMFKLVGMSGGFVMHTNSRERDDGPYSGVWKNGGFSFDTEGSIPGGFDEDEYGTEFELVLSDDISLSNIRDWVSKNAYRSRVPVIYNEYDSDGTNMFNEDYGNSSFDDEYPDDAIILKVDSPHFEARCSNESLGETVLLDVPISRNARKVPNAPWSYGVDIRLKNENGVVVDGPHEGLMPVSEGEYSEMTEDRREHYVPESRLSEPDVVMPSPIGTRDSLGSQPEFWSWLGEQFQDKYTERVQSVFDTIDESDDIWDLSPVEFDLLNRANTNKSDAEPSHVQDLFERKFDINISENLAKTLLSLNRKVDIAPRNRQATYRRKSNLHRGKWVREVCRDVMANGRDGEVYMGQTLNDEKATIVHEDNEHNVVARVDSDEYEFYADALGWKLLKKVTKSSVRDGKYDISEDTRESFLDSSNSQSSSDEDSLEKTTATTLRDGPQYAKVKLHRKRGPRGQDRVSCGEIKDACEYADENDKKPTISRNRRHAVVAFPESAERNISDHYYMLESASLFKCSDDAWEYLEGTPFVYHADEFIEKARTTEFKTSDGVHTLETAPDNLVFHVVSTPDVDADEFRKDGRIERIARVIENEPWDSYIRGPKPGDDIVYAPMNKHELRELIPAMKKDQPICVTKSYLVPDSVGVKQNLPSERVLFIHSEIGDVAEENHTQYLSDQLRGKLDPGTVSHISFCRDALQAGVTPDEFPDN